MAHVATERVYEKALGQPKTSRRGQLKKVKKTAGISSEFQGRGRRKTSGRGQKKGVNLAMGEGRIDY